MNRIRERSIGIAGAMLAGVLGMILSGSPAIAEPGRGRPELSAEPQRSYGSIDVILYQTSW